MSLTSTARKLAAAGATITFASGGAVLLVTPANAAPSDGVFSYTCNTPGLGDYAVKASHTYASEVVYGGELAVTTTLTFPARFVEELNQVGITAISNYTSVDALLAGVPIPSGQFSQRTPVPASGTMDVVTSGGAQTPVGVGAARSGETAALALVDGDGRDLFAKVYTYNADGTVNDSVLDFDCELADGQDLNLGTVYIKQASTTAAAALRYADRTGKVVSKAVLDAVRSNTFPTGKVRLVLKRNGVRVDSARVLLDKGVASMRTAAPKKGDYRLVVRYLGNRDFSGSEATLTKSF